MGGNNGICLDHVHFGSGVAVPQIFKFVLGEDLLANAFRELGCSDCFVSD